MLKSCKYCGKIHDSRFDCGKKPQRIYIKRDYSTESRQFRRKESWKQMSLRIRDRDNHLCQVCLRGLYKLPGASVLNYENISVHHIEPIKDAPEKKLDPYNLISLCSMHHEMADSGEIPAELLKNMALAQEYSSENSPPGV